MWQGAAMSHRGGDAENAAGGGVPDGVTIGSKKPLPSPPPGCSLTLTALAAGRADRQGASVVGVVAALVIMSSLLLRSVRDQPKIVGFMVVVAVLAVIGLCLSNSRLVFSAGADWFAIDKAFGSSWIRTHEIVRLRSGFGNGQTVLALQDRDRHRLRVMLGHTRDNPRLWTLLSAGIEASGVKLNQRAERLIAWTTKNWPPPATKH
jgi:hypothetical protein